MSSENGERGGSAGAGSGQQAMLASQRAQEQGQPGRFAQWFPLGAKEGWNQWWSSQSPAATEHHVLSFIPYLQQPPTHLDTAAGPGNSSDGTPNGAPHIHDEEHVTTNRRDDPYGPRRWNSEMVELSGKGRALNEFSVERVGEEVENHLVMLHGYGAGLGFFYRNYEALSRVSGWKVIALDLLGMGRSSRPPFRIAAKDREAKITEAEDWFIDALEEWRIKRGIKKFTLLGHSLGGYLATCYALKYPGRLEKLILASPVGIPEDPYAVNEALPDPNRTTAAAAEFEPTQGTPDEREAFPPMTTSNSDGNNLLNQAKKSEGQQQGGTVGPRRRQLPKWVTFLWEANMLSPFTFVRWSGPLGPRLVSGWTSRRFGHLPENEAQALHEYSYSIFRQRGSSEYALSFLLAPGAFARSPLIRRIAEVGRREVPTETMADVSGTSPSPSASSGGFIHVDAASSQSSPAPANKSTAPIKEAGLPVLFMYGSHDWMDVNGGYAATEKILQKKQELLRGKSREEKARDRADAKVVIIDRAGHHLYLEGADQFNRVVVEEMEELKKWQRRQL